MHLNAAIKWPLFRVALSTQTKKVGPEEHSMGRPCATFARNQFGQTKRAGQVRPALQMKRLWSFGGRPRSRRLQA